MEDTFIGYNCSINNSTKTGVTLELNSSSLEDFKEHYIVSLDDSLMIERVPKNKIQIKNKLNGNDFFKRLIRDIQSTDETTRINISRILIGFNEFSLYTIDSNLLIKHLEIILKILEHEENVDVEYNLIESIDELLMSTSLKMNEKIWLLERLTKIDSPSIYNLLEGRDEFSEIEMVKEYLIEKKKTIANNSYR